MCSSQYPNKYTGHPSQSDPGRWTMEAGGGEAAPSVDEAKTPPARVACYGYTQDTGRAGIPQWGGAYEGHPA